MTIFSMVFCIFLRINIVRSLLKHVQVGNLNLLIGKNVYNTSSVECTGKEHERMINFLFLNIYLHREKSASVWIWYIFALTFPLIMMCHLHNYKIRRIKSWLISEQMFHVAKYFPIEYQIHWGYLKMSGIFIWISNWEDNQKQKSQHLEKNTQEVSTYQLIT